MRGVVLAGGLGTRLAPMTLVTNKHLLPVYDRPMVSYPVQALAQAGIDEIMIVTSDHHASGFRTLFAEPAAHGLERIEFGIQPGPGGIADALLVARDFAEGHPVCCMLGDNIYEYGVHEAADRFRANWCAGAHALLAQVDDPARFGVCRFSGSGPDSAIAEIIEKPAAHPPSNWAVTGAYFFDAGIFDVCAGLEPSARGELEITSANNAYIARGSLTHSLVRGWWTDAGTVENLHEAACAVVRTGANKRR